jgi:hypothetical protein
LWLTAEWNASNGADHLPMSACFFQCQTTVVNGHSLGQRISNPSITLL